MRLQQRQIRREDVDAFLFIGGGKFHALGRSLSYIKTYCNCGSLQWTGLLRAGRNQENPQTTVCKHQEAQRVRNFGILISLKPGQKHLDEALKIKEAAEKNGKTACLLAVREILPEVLSEFPTVDAYVNTACPRISLDDASKFKKPVLTVQEFRVISGESSWENLLKNGLFEN